MERISSIASALLARDAGFVALAATTLMVGFSFDPPLALLIGAQIALLYCLFLLYRVVTLSVERVVRSEVWRDLPKHQRPHDPDGLTRAHWRLQDVHLHFAKGCSGIASVLLAASLAASTLK